MSIVGSTKLLVGGILGKLGRRIWPVAFPQVEQRLGSVEQHLPAFLNAISSVGAFGYQLRRQAEALDRQNADIGRLWERIEFVRREVLYEMKFGGTPSAPEPIKARIVQPDKIAAARGKGLRLNLGCGHIALPDYINVDQREVPGVDIISDIGNLPLPQASALEVFSSHVLEHFPQEELRRRLLPHWHSLLAPKGSFRAIVPDGEAMLEHFASGTYPFEDFREVLFGAQEYDGDFHYNLFTPASLRGLLEEVGFVEVDVPAKGRKNGKCYEFEIYATRP